MFWLWLALTSLVAGGSKGQQVTHADSTDFRDVEEYVIDRMGSARIPGMAVAIVEGDSVLYLKGFGIADPSGRPVTPQTPFMIGSITKSFTALAVMQLVDAGKVDLDAPVKRYVPWFRLADAEASAQITVRNLLTMTSGIPQSYETQLWTASDGSALERAVRSLRTAAPAGPAGRTFGYSNANYETLGLIVQMVSGMSYEEYLKRHVFAPLAMHNTFVSQDEAIHHGMSSGYRWWFGIPVAAALPYHRSELPAGYIIASTEDVTHFVIAELNGGRFDHESILSPRLMALRHAAPPAHGYGLGWEFSRLNGRKMISHDGGTANFQTSLFIDPAAKVGVYIAANVINALDAFASPHGSSPLDGQTTRGMAKVVLSMVTHEPLPDVGPGHEGLTLIYDFVLALISGALAISLARIPVRLRRLADDGIPDHAQLVRRRAVTVLLNFPLGIALFYLWLAVPAWKVLVEFEPDLGVWLVGVAILLAVKGAIELAFASRVFSRSHRSLLNGYGRRSNGNHFSWIGADARSLVAPRESPRSHFGDVGRAGKTGRIR